MKVRVDPAKCQAHGTCNEICPSVFKLDEWGYAFVDGDGDVPADLLDAATKAVEDCPEDAISSAP